MGNPIDRTFIAIEQSLVGGKTGVLDLRGRAGGGIMARSDLSESGVIVTFNAGDEGDPLYPVQDGAGAVLSVQISPSVAVAIPEDVMKFAYLECVFSGVAAITGTVVIVGKS